MLHPTRIEMLAGGLAMAVLVTATGQLVAQPARGTASIPGGIAGRTAVGPDTVGAASTTRPAALKAGASPRARAIGRLRAGILVPVTDVRRDFVRVLTPCEVTAWIARTDVTLHLKAAGSPATVADATIVLDPGHGGSHPGAVGRRRTPEKAPNLAIARAARAHLDGARVFLTRNGDFDAGLTFRTTLANTLNAHAFVSIHNNAEPDGRSSRPGTETYYQHASAASKRLAGLTYEQMVAVLDDHRVPWVADDDAGAKFRTNVRGDDYYGVLRRTRVPAVLVEGMFITNPPEEALLRRPEVHDGMGRAIAAGIARFLTTDDPGSGFTEPRRRNTGPSGRLPSDCRDPA